MSDKKQGESNLGETPRGRPKTLPMPVQPADLPRLPEIATVPSEFGPEVVAQPVANRVAAAPAATAPVAAASVAAASVAAGKSIVEQAVHDVVAMERTVVEALHTPTAVPPIDPLRAYPSTFVNFISKEKIMTTTEELVSFQQANFEAMIKSSQIWAAGVQDLGRQVAATMQAQIEETVGAVKAMTSAKSLREAVELQSSLTRNSVEKVVTEGSKLTDASMKLAEQAWAPITARLTTAAERFSRAA